VLIVSTELDEVLALADRVAVMYQGRIVEVLDAAEATPEHLGLLMGGSRPVGSAELASSGAGVQASAGARGEGVQHDG
jgi:hypothetical protein